MLLWFIVIIEFLGKYYYQFFGANYIIYNIYHLINFCFLLFLYKNYVESNRYKKLISWFFYLYLAFFFGNLLFQNYFTQIQTVPFIMGALFVIISILFLFIEILRSDRVLYVTKNLLFWISVGLLLYFVGRIPTRIIKNYWEEISYYKSIYIVEYILSIIMNVCFIIGFICSEKNKQY
ncbi:hypothetical protein JoomaDRAFT_0332 [Galbibacter orientalis DSM 19592]|uniref:Uncharacterized protein n=1 Tax=Galbibacter orientalis DSM 19592 TaxID=926559 RepID=I3C196_9FLAO|nr:hypothetical protein JoomaDRAFT_0332 [Galbibacter orientalis DSM 19592]